MDEVELRILKLISDNVSLLFGEVFAAADAPGPVVLHRLDRLRERGFIGDRGDFAAGRPLRIEITPEGREWLHLKGLLG